MMKAAVLIASGKIEVQDKPIPKASPDSAVVKVLETALCGSDLHYYRGHIDVGKGFTMGHEFTGIITEIGSEVTGFKVGDKVVSPFTVCCMQCYYCKVGLTCRCEKSRVYGSPALEGAQAEYVDVPLADTTLFKAPDDVEDETLILMADIFPTGYYAASNALKMMSPAEKEEVTVVVIGCGPVGFCAITSAKHFKPKRLFAIDSVPERLERAEKVHGATALHLDEDPKAAIMKATDGRGADVVLEIVGHADALRLAFDVLRPGGFIHSVGMHHSPLPIGGYEAYGKNVRMQFGRCPVRHLFKEALEVLQEHKEDFKGFVSHRMPLTDAPKAYDLFEARKVQKVVFTV
ncbi:Alcohol dehydrogenase [Taphrina deformans PYCC 5710]|uniref:Alcohol dehydrogenase n=1 Tax=Taphrina deformans (strain PYCC 5710 / ATCC 11124 / CBS 356.35 / IMI 108563 / JCM 9778 / NBRC 8474) TaxID=1097556 RepID=R4X6M3_TAPDE|nr:Alcohol dehydrogenase [Taphrina deformans PYCC 5710]|eukprot:CCG80822.1 Alcohol dehydrogenase [Taphrina deformans PYCC 5710]